MGSSSLEQRLPDPQFLTLRRELMRASTLLSCDQALNLADLLHTIIRMRKPCRPICHVDQMLLAEARAFECGPPDRATAYAGCGPGPAASGSAVEA